MSYYTITKDAESAKAWSSTTTWNHTIGSGRNRMLLVLVSVRNESATSVTYDGVAMTKIGDSSTYNASIWALPNPNIGTNQVAVTLSGSDDFAGGGISLFGAAQTDYVDDVDNAGGDAGSGTVSTTVTSTIPNGIAVQCVIHQHDSNGTFGSGQDAIYNSSGNDGGAGSSKTYSSAGNVTMTYTADDSKYQTVAAIKPAPVRGGGIILLNL